MGSACCVAAKDRTITDRSVSDVVPRHDRYSPSWSFRWDNRGRVAGEESSLNCYSDGGSMNDRMDNKSYTTVETTFATDGSPLDSSRSLTWQKASFSEEIVVPQPDPLNSKNLHEGKELRGAPVPLELSPTKMSTPSHSVSSFSASPLSSSQGHVMPLSSLTPSRWPRRSPGHHLLRQVSDSRIRGIMSPNFSISEEGSPFMHPGWSNKSNRGSHGGSSDSWSIPAFSELVATSNRDRWSFDSGSLSFSRDRISRSSGRVSSSPSIDMQTCGFCSRLLTERSSFSSQKIVATNGLPVVSVLTCGHIYHAECLENMTPEVNKYDPACPICTLGEKKVLKLSEKALGAQMDLKGKLCKKLRNRVMDGDSVLFDRLTSGKGPRMGSSSSMKTSTSTTKPFLRRHFSFGYKPNRSMSDNSSRKKRFFWTKSSKE
ncbi:Zinc finger, RING/FYVE/PHD-type [Artemisia annua]|uniref:Zinc finger, RING/FYVE/PHD-type n=1 Tax=Artemisia annua TaxID=35608 RepID=A0A2U1PGD2_ARTAN|nr:Zinc finger, RING/FYVE/PHD-type [Artemisia annua]